MKMAQSREIQSRKVFLDILRVLATCAVVLLHTISGVKDNTDMSLYPTQQRVFMSVLDLVTWSVPVFIMISGYLFLNPARQFTMKQMLVKYCRRIVLALVLFGVPYACIELVITERSISIQTVGRAVLMVLQGKSWSHMWYLYLILLLYLLTPFMKWILQKVSRIWIYVVMAVLFIGSSIFPWINQCFGTEFLVLPDIGIYFFYYLCGFLIVSKPEKSRSMEKSRASRRILLLAIGILIIGMISYRLLTTQQINLAYAYPPTVILSVLLFLGAANWNLQLQEKAARSWRAIGSLCFTIYLVHPVYVNIFYKFLNLTPLDFPLGVSLPIFWLVIMVLSVGSAWILGKIPILRKYVL